MAQTRLLALTAIKGVSELLVEEGATFTTDAETAARLMDAGAATPATAGAPDNARQPDPDPERIEAIAEAAAALDPHDTDAWTVDGSPQVSALERALGQDISAAERDAAWALVGSRQRADT